MFKSPVYNVIGVPIDMVEANSFNPNVHKGNTMKLLKNSIESDGMTQPIVAYLRPDGKYEIIDGYHRYLTLLNNPDLLAREGGKVPICPLNKDESHRMASTIRHNKARGTHDITKTESIVEEMKANGKSDAWIQENLGVSPKMIQKMVSEDSLLKWGQEKEYTQAWITVPNPDYKGDK